MLIKNKPNLSELVIEMAGVIDDFNLIKLVEANPILYDKDTSRGQRNASLKDSVWKELSMKLQASERACITRWKSIRDRFGKEYRRAQENPNEPTNWDMFPHLLFLKDHYKHGNARNDAIEIKYEPKGRKRKSKSRWGDGQNGKDEDNDENDHEEIMTSRNLISLVKEHPVLYDKQKIRDSKNLVLKNNAWDHISKSLGISEEDCFKRWKKLRDRFAREYRYQVIMPEKPVSWIYFHDLMFLEGHYRKGIPLIVENLKRRPKELSSCPPKRAYLQQNMSNSENSWDPEYGIVCGEESVGDLEETICEAENEETYLDIDPDIDELLIMPGDKNEADLSSTTEVLTEVIPIPNGEIISTMSIEPTAIPENTKEPSAEAQLSEVIYDMQKVLRRSEDCLRSLQEENRRYKEEIAELKQSNSKGLLGKIKFMLSDLSSEAKAVAERKILKFLYECQISFLNNEDIEDVTSISSPSF